MIKKTDFCITTKEMDFYWRNDVESAATYRIISSYPNKHNSQAAEYWYKKIGLSFIAIESLIDNKNAVKYYFNTEENMTKFMMEYM